MRRVQHGLQSLSECAEAVGPTSALAIDSVAISCMKKSAKAEHAKKMKEMLCLV